MEVAAKILKGFTISKPQRKFLLNLFTTILTCHGKINFRNLSRYSHVSEETYSRQYAKAFDFVSFNRALIKEGTDKKGERIIVLDASFVCKSGKKTYGLDYFWNGCHRRSEKGLEISCIAIVDVEKQVGFTLSVRQTAAKEASQTCVRDDKESPSLAKAEKKPKPKKKKKGAKKKKKAKSKKQPVEQEEDEETLINQYLEHLQQIKPFLSEDEIYTVVDGYFSKKKFVDGVCELNLHQIGKLRGDANMRYLYTGPKRLHGSGRQKTYDGKVNWQDLSRFNYVDTQDGIAIYTLVLNHVSLKRNVKVVVLVDQNNKDKDKDKDKDKLKYAILFSTDIDIDAKTLLKYYKARFQVEFIFRDAKQFTGLCDCQARDQKRLDFHFNAALTTLNLAKLEHLQMLENTPSTPFSMASIKACYFNRFFIARIFSMLDLDPNLINKSPHAFNLWNFGKIAA